MTSRSASSLLRWFGAVAAVLARVLLAERLAASQMLGVGTIIAGVAALGVLQA